jgi:hypothetical protein
LSKPILCVALTLATLHASTAYAVTWEEQAERLQNVSATLLDGVPFTNPVTHNFSLQIQIPLSLLPKVNPTVGAKTEKVPASPVHTIPTLKISSFVGRSPLFDLGVQLWAGFLAPGAESLVGIKASLTQKAVGGAVVPSKNLGGMNVYVSVGGQISMAELTGGITGADAHDKFTADTTLLFISPGFYSPSRLMWGSVTIGQKTTDSRFEIPSDKTTIELNDTLSDAKFAYFVQGNLGMSFQNGVQIAIAELWVPNRLLMPRMLLGYEIFSR